MKLKYKAIKNCIVCNGKGYFTSAMDFVYRCDCFKRTKLYKNRKKEITND